MREFERKKREEEEGSVRIDLMPSIGARRRRRLSLLLLLVLSLSFDKERLCGPTEELMTRTLSTHSMLGQRKRRVQRGKREKKKKKTLSSLLGSLSRRWFSDIALFTLSLSLIENERRRKKRLKQEHDRRPRAPRGRLARRRRRRAARREGRVGREPARPHAGPLWVRKGGEERRERERQAIERRPFSLSLTSTSSTPT